MELQARAGESIKLVELALGFLDKVLQGKNLGRSSVAGSELRGEAFDRALRGHDLLAVDIGELELHRQRLREELRIAARDARAAAGAARDVDDPQAFERAQRVARRHAAHAMPSGEVLLGAEEVARAVASLEQRFAHVGDDPRREGGRAAGKEGVDAHWAKDNIFNRTAKNRKRCAFPPRTPVAGGRRWVSPGGLDRPVGGRRGGPETSGEYGGTHEN